MTTPMWKQYQALKKQHSREILFFRLGDFYESFGDDARLVADVCGIALTSRPIGKGTRVPLAGVPYHSVDGHIAKLVRAGHKVAIAEQMESASVRGLVPREVRRVVTPGTVVEPGLLEEKKNNYLVGLVSEADRAGIAYVDITTGEFAATELAGATVGQMIVEELARIMPAEVVCPDDGSVRSLGDSWSEEMTRRITISPLDTWQFEQSRSRRILLDHFDAASLGGYGLEALPVAQRAAGGLIQYLQATQPDALVQVRDLRSYSTSEYMVLDPSTWRNLEIAETIRGGGGSGSLLGVLDRTLTPMGGRLLRKWVGRPLLDLVMIEERLDAVQALHDDMGCRMGLRDVMKGVGDLERWTTRVVQGIAGPRELAGIRDTLGRVPEMMELIWGSDACRGGGSDVDHGGTGSGVGGGIVPLVDGLAPNRDVADLLARALADEPSVSTAAGGVIKRGYSGELDSIRDSANDGRSWISGLEVQERERTGIKSLKVGYNKVFGYYIEVTKANQQLVPEDYIRKQTLVNAERYITPELKEYEALVLNAEERLRELEAALFGEVVQTVGSHSEGLLTTAAAIARIDVLSSLAEVAVSNRYARPEVGTSLDLRISAGRHPVVELMQSEEPFQPNDVSLSEDGHIIILTGPNMSGKSTYLRQVALIVLMAQMGSFVPADAAYVGIVDRVFTRIGAADEIASGRSTFMVEMVETANILHHASERSLLILDEIGRGTSTFDGMAIAWAVIEYVHNHPRLRSKTLFATHYHELTVLTDVLPRVRNFNVAVAGDGEDVVFLHQIEPGCADRSYGIHVGKLAGLPRSVIHRAEEILEDLESNTIGPGPRPGIQPEQMALFVTDDPAVEELKALDISQLTPLEAITKLYEFQQRLGKR